MAIDLSSFAGPMGTGFSQVIKPYDPEDLALKMAQIKATEAHAQAYRAQAAGVKGTKAASTKDKKKNDEGGIYQSHIPQYGNVAHSLTNSAVAPIMAKPEYQYLLSNNFMPRPGADAQEVAVANRARNMLGFVEQSAQWESAANEKMVAAEEARLKKPKEIVLSDTYYEWRDPQKREAIYGALLSPNPQVRAQGQAKYQQMMENLNAGNLTLLRYDMSDGINDIRKNIPATTDSNVTATGNWIQKENGTWVEASRVYSTAENQYLSAGDKTLQVTYPGQVAARQQQVLQNLQPAIDRLANGETLENGMNLNKLPGTFSTDEDKRKDQIASALMEHYADKGWAALKPEEKLRYGNDPNLYAHAMGFSVYDPENKNSLAQSYKYDVAYALGGVKEDKGLVANPFALAATKHGYDMTKLKYASDLKEKDIQEMSISNQPVGTAQTWTKEKYKDGKLVDSGGWKPMGKPMQSNTLTINAPFNTKTGKYMMSMPVTDWSAAYSFSKNGQVVPFSQEMHLNAGTVGEAKIKGIQYLNLTDEGRKRFGKGHGDKRVFAGDEESHEAGAYFLAEVEVFDPRLKQGILQENKYGTKVLTSTGLGTSEAVPVRRQVLIPATQAAIDKFFRGKNPGFSAIMPKDEIDKYLSPESAQAEKETQTNTGTPPPRTKAW